MTILIKNKSQLSSVNVSLYRLFNDSKIYTKNLQPQKMLDIPIDDLKNGGKSLNLGAVLLVVKTHKNNLIWKGAIPISSDSTPIKINPETKEVFYGEIRIPSLVSSSTNCSAYFLVFVVFVILLLIVVIYSKKK